MTQKTETGSRNKEVFFHGKKFTKDLAYAQAVKVGDTLYISGTVSFDDEGNLVEGDISEQTRFIYKDIEKILAAHGATFTDVIKEGIFTTDIDSFMTEAVPVRVEFYEGHTLPASGAWVQVEKLARPGLLVEIEATVLLP